MTHIPSTRAAHVIGFTEVLRKIGTPVDRELRRSKLPGLIEEIPDAWVSNIFAMDFIGRCAHQEGIADIGWLGVENFRLSQLNEDVLGAVSQAQTVLGRLRRFFELVALEDNGVAGGILSERSSARVWFNSPRVPEAEPVEVSEWFQIGILVEVIRSVLGRRWCPTEIAFQSSFQVCDAARREFGNTRFLFGHSATSILMPKIELTMDPSLECEKEMCRSFALSSDAQSIDLSTQIQMLMSAYWGEIVPSIELASDMAGTSVRTLQRRLDAESRAFSDLVEASRFDVARQMLADPSRRITDVAFAVGYEDSSNFARAFRRVAGVSPRAFRQAVTESAIAAE